MRLPALDVVTRGGPAVRLDVRQMAANDWLVLLAESTHDLAAAAERLHAQASSHFEPALSLRAAASGLGESALGAALARVELDGCGAWVTLSCAGVPQPVVVRKAGWIDYRATARPPLTASDDDASTGRQLADDRVGLGPGDTLVLLSSYWTVLTDAGGKPFTDEALPTALLGACGRGASATASWLREQAGSFVGRAVDPPLLVVRVPDLPPEELRRRIATATGVTVEQLQALRYPLGEQLMRERPAPPRQARMRLDGDLREVTKVRNLVRRLLASWRMPEVFIDDVELLASELAANAIHHGQSPVTVITRYDGDCIRLEVGDGSRELPRQRRELSMSAEDGRGMFLVDQLSRAWGTTGTMDGKRVWCEVALPSALD